MTEYPLWGIHFRISIIKYPLYIFFKLTLIVYLTVGINSTVEKCKNVRAYFTEPLNKMRLSIDFNVIIFYS